MTIRDKILEVKQKLLLELISGDRTFSNELQETALLGINKGPGSAELRTYMSNFAETPAQLSRLMAEDGTENNIGMNRARAYLLADAPCGTETVTNFGNNTTIILDDNLP